MFAICNQFENYTSRAASTGAEYLREREYRGTKLPCPWGPRCSRGPDRYRAVSLKSCFRKISAVILTKLLPGTFVKPVPGPH